MELAETPPKPELHEKHKRYASAYKPYDTYWGLGIECEAYIETAPSAHLQVPGSHFISHQAPNATVCGIMTPTSLIHTMKRSKEL